MGIGQTYTVCQRMLSKGCGCAGNLLTKEKKLRLNPFRIYKRNLPVPSINHFLNEEEVETALYIAKENPGMICPVESGFKRGSEKFLESVLFEEKPAQKTKRLHAICLCGACDPHTDSLYIKTKRGRIVQAMYSYNLVLSGNYQIYADDYAPERIAQGDCFILGLTTLHWAEPVSDDPENVLWLVGFDV